MGLIYDFYENPPKAGSTKKPRLHARVVPYRTVNTQEMAEIIHSCSTLTVGDINAALSMFREQIIDHLKDGNRVHWDGVGYFELTLSCPPVKSAKDIRGESVRTKSIVFRPEKNFKREFINIRPKRSRRKRHSNRYSDIEIDGLLTSHFLDHLFITSREFCRLCGLTQSTAARRLRKLVTDGKLQKTGHYKSPLYEPAKGHYRR